MTSEKEEFERNVRLILDKLILSRGVRITDEAITHIATHMPKYIEYIRADSKAMITFIEWYVLGYVMGKVEATRELTVYKKGTEQ